jgi:hypothetical protein
MIEIQEPVIEAQEEEQIAELSLNELQMVGGGTVNGVTL